jgi:hypothetical protein
MVCVGGVCGWCVCGVWGCSVWCGVWCVVCSVWEVDFDWLVILDQAGYGGLDQS